MPVTAISSQPAQGSLNAAYRPVVATVTAVATTGTALPPYVACDVYVRDRYHRTILRTAPDSTSGAAGVYTFNVSDALQEVLQADLAPLGNTEILPARHLSAKVFLKFRASGLDADGFTVEEGPTPTPGTRFTDPASGGGLQSNTFFAIGSALQHEDNQDLQAHLSFFKRGPWASGAYPLTHRPAVYKVCPGDSDHFPLVYPGNCMALDLVLRYRMRGSLAWLTATASDESPCTPPGFTVVVNGTSVAVSLDEALPAGQQVMIRYRLQGDAAWTIAGTYSTQNITFSTQLAGTYDIEAVRFCSACISSSPEAGTFTIAEEAVTTLAWRGKDPYCLVAAIPGTVYVKLELRGVTEEENWYPTQSAPQQQTVIERGNLYALFYSDAALLQPVAVTTPITVPVKVVEDQYNGSYSKRIELLQSYAVNPSGTEVLVTSDVVITSINTSYDGSIDSPGLTTTRNLEYEPFPSAQLQGGATGQQGFANLEQYNTVSELPTGITKANTEGTEGYVAPVLNTTVCPVGIDAVTVMYGYALEVAKVEFRFGSPAQYLYATPVTNTSAGGFRYVLPVPVSQAVQITIKAKALATGSTTGFIKARVNLLSGDVLEFDVPNNTETLLPGSFTGVSSLNISNY